MSSKTSIEWTDETHQPGIYGCSHHGKGCINCYAERLSHRLGNMGQPAYAGATEGWRWTGQVQVVPVEQAVASILGLPRRRGFDRPVRTFVTSMADMLHEQVPTDWTARVIVAMAERTDRIFQVLTHRGRRWPEVARRVIEARGYWPPNVWAGLSVSTQEEVDREVPGLLQVPRAVRFLSLEPLLGAIDLGRAIGHMHIDRLSPAGRCDHTCPRCWGPQVQWVIVGGESGPKARPMHPDWARSIRDQCVEAGVAFHFKQWGAWAPKSMPWDVDYEESARPSGMPPWEEAGGAVAMFRIGKKAAGRLLDGRTWDEFPEVSP